MKPSLKIHAELLKRQAAELFRAVNDRGIHRNRYNEFKPMILDGQPAIEYCHILPEKSVGRSYADIHVKTDSRDYWFRQWFNFGVLLNMDVLHQAGSGPCTALDDTMNAMSEDQSFEHSLLIDFEYALSIATEGIATNLTLLE